jgi:hypothetical protein
MSDGKIITPEEKKKRRLAATAKYRNANRLKTRAASKTWRKANPEKVRAQKRAVYRRSPTPATEVYRRAARRLYGLSASDVEALRVKQRGRCAVCAISFTKTPDIDHDHQTGIVRGLLDRACNVTIAVLGDEFTSLVGYSLLRQDQMKGAPPRVVAAWSRFEKRNLWAAALDYLAKASGVA